MCDEEGIELKKDCSGKFNVRVSPELHADISSAATAEGKILNQCVNDPCENCGICCLAFSLPPFDANELVKASDALLQQVDAYARSARYRNSNPCLWLDLDSGKCKHYKSRPVLCRWFEPGCQACDNLRVEAGLPRLRGEDVSS